MLPFSDVGINPIIGNAVVEIVQEWLSGESDKPLDVEDIAGRVGRSAKHIKPVVYLLAVMRTLKMTFIPHCRTCGAKVGERYVSSFMIRDELFFCDDCNKIVNERDCETRMEFWRPGAQVDAR